MIDKNQETYKTVFNNIQEIFGLVLHYELLGKYQKLLQKFKSVNANCLYILSYAITSLIRSLLRGINDIIPSDSNVINNERARFVVCSS